ncbi:hypothetical protein V8E53_006045 [Lactarius tabidus]
MSNAEQRGSFSETKIGMNRGRFPRLLWYRLVAACLQELTTTDEGSRVTVHMELRAALPLRPVTCDRVPILVLLAVFATEGVNILRDSQSILYTMQENPRDTHAVRDYIKAITIPSHVARPPSPIPRCAAPKAAPSSPETQKMPYLASTALREPPSLYIAGEGHVLQGIMDVTRFSLKALHGQELVEARPSRRIRLAIKAALSRSECEPAAGVVKASVPKMLAWRK